MCPLLANQPAYARRFPYSSLDDLAKESLLGRSVLDQLLCISQADPRELHMLRPFEKRSRKIALDLDQEIGLAPLNAVVT